MLVYVQAIEVFAEKVGTIRIVAKTADHCAVDNHGVENIHHVQVRQSMAYAEQLHRCAQYFRPFLSRYSACLFLIGDTEFSPEKTSKTKRGGKRRKKKRDRGRERTRERELMMVGRDKVLV